MVLIIDGMIASRDFVLRCSSGKEVTNFLCHSVGLVNALAGMLIVESACTGIVIEGCYYIRIG